MYRIYLLGIGDTVEYCVTTYNQSNTFHVLFLHNYTTYLSIRHSTSKASDHCPNESLGCYRTGRKTEPDLHHYKCDATSFASYRQFGRSRYQRQCASVLCLRRYLEKSYDIPYYWSDGNGPDEIVRAKSASTQRGSIHWTTNLPITHNESHVVLVVYRNHNIGIVTHNIKLWVGAIHDK